MNQSKITQLEQEVSRLKEAIEKAKSHNLAGIKSMFSGFVAYAEIEFKKAHAVLDKAVNHES